MKILNTNQYISEKLVIKPITKNRLSELDADIKSVPHNRDIASEFLGLFDELDEAEISKGCTYLLSDNMGHTERDVWRVCVYVRNEYDEDLLYSLCWSGGYKRFNGGDCVLCFGKENETGYGKVIFVEKFKKMFEEEEQGKHTLHNYYINNIVE